VRNRKRFEPLAVVGLIGTILLHGGALVGVLLYRRALLAEEKPPPIGSYVVAKLVRLGKPRDPNKLPNKEVPQQATKKEEAIDLSADADDAPARKRDRDRRKVDVSDKLRNALDKAELLAQAQQEIEGEGSPDGVAGGTARSGQEGDPYMTRIADLWLRTWSLPAVIPTEEARRLYVKIVIRIDGNGTIQFPLEFDRKSGNTYFDNSIIAAWKQIKQIPKPPPDRFASILANGMPLKLNWKGMQ
jgi:hypothetical protein